MPSDLFLCVDCGGSKTAVAIADRTGQIVARALGGPSNFAYLGAENFVRTVKVAVENALRIHAAAAPTDAAPSLPMDPSPFAAAWFGVSGVDSPAAAARLTTAIAPLLSLPPGPHLRVANDTHLLAAPLALHPAARSAVAVIGGTGSIAVSFRRAEGGAGGGLEEMARVGGWGWILGDEGGGFDVGREALRHILREYDLASLWGVPQPGEAEAAPRPKTLTQRVLAHFGVDSPPELLTLVHDGDPRAEDADASAPESAPLQPHRLIAREKRLSQLSPLVFAAAFGDADPLALAVLRTTSGTLAAQVEALLAPAVPQGAGEEESKPVAPRAVHAAESVACFGGSLVGIAPYRDMLLGALAQRGHVFKHVEFVEDAAAVGAVGLAAQFARDLAT